MQDTKTEFKYFPVFEWEKEQDYLRQQHKNGWKFVRVSFIGVYHFERCRPEDTVYQLDYNPDGLEHKEEYIQMFHDCGWEYLQDFWGYSYFRKPASEMNGDEEIFCDEASRTEMIKQVLKGHMLPPLILFTLIILPNIYIQSHYNRPVNDILTIVFLALFIIYLVIFLFIGYQFWKYWKLLRK